MVHSFRQKPLGWRHDSHRHYLAAKGISTKRYFVRNELKGNRAPPIYKSGYAQGKTKAEVDAELIAKGLSIWVPRARRQKNIFETSEVPMRQKIEVPRENIELPSVI